MNSNRDSAEIEHGPYKIHKYSNPEVIPIERYPKLMGISNITSLAVWVFYDIVQFTIAYSAQRGQAQILWHTWVGLVAEFLLSFQERVLNLSYTFCLFSTTEYKSRPCYKILGDLAPSIDVFIPCCGESVDIILDTICAAADQDYPSSRYRVFVLDDGGNPKLQDEVEKRFGKSQPNQLEGASSPPVLYLSRKYRSDIRPEIMEQPKSGNNQFGIEETERLGGSDFFASVDADMIAQPDWLRRMIPHLILDEKVGMACPPQRYYNVPQSDPFGQQAEFDWWFTLYEPLNDRLDGAMCTGSGYVARRKAVNDIGGWPLIGAGDDIMCSAALTNGGWKMVFVRENLQSGLAPDSIGSHIKQRMSWVDSTIVTNNRFNYFLPGSTIPLNMTTAQRIISFFFAVANLGSVRNVVAILALPAAIFPTPNNDLNLVSGQNRGLVLTVFLAAWLVKLFNDTVMYGWIGMYRMQNVFANDIWTAPVCATRCILSIIPRQIAHKLSHSQAAMSALSSGAVSSSHERSWLRRKPLLYRLTNMYAIGSLLFVVYGSLAVVFHMQVYGNITRSPLHPNTCFPFPGMVLKMLECIGKASTPLLYMALPPTVPEREELMERKNGRARRPRKEAATSSSGVIERFWWAKSVCFVAVVIYSCI